MRVNPLDETLALLAVELLERGSLVHLEDCRKLLVSFPTEENAS